MSLEIIHLRKALKFCMLDDDRAFSALRREAYEDRRRQESSGEGGGDFFGPFWSDAKRFAIDGDDLVAATGRRIEVHEGRARLYPILCERFSDWWRRFEGAMNEPLVPLGESVHARLQFDDLDVTIKVDNLLSFQIDRERHRLIYPYFSEAPPLSQRWARIGLWVMAEALNRFRPQDMVILDAQRGRSFSLRELDFRGDEEDIFMDRMAELRVLWDNILDEAA
ncbi:hypothetical protein [Erythrobacter aureus]|uniref:hypothetical protein n=1 Tax=Erythrobacter aureus TaxID=2182384 RepID=UPI003A8EC75D